MKASTQGSSSLRPALPYAIGLMAFTLPFLSGGRGAMSQLMIIALSAAAALLLLRENNKSNTSVALIALTTLSIAALLSLITSPVPGATLSKALLFAGYALLLWVTMQFSLAEAKKLIAAITVAGVLLILFGFYAHFFADRSFNVPLSSTYYNANGLAGFLVIFTILSASFYWSTKRLWLRALFGLLATVSLLAIVMTGSRGALLGLAGAALFAAVAVVRRRRARPWSIRQIGLGLLIPAAVAAVAALVISLTPMSGTLSSAFQDEPRLGYWAGAVELGAGSPLIGTGAGSFARLYPEMQKNALSFSRDPHSKIFEAFAETGILGLSAVLLFSVAVFWIAWKGIVGATDDEYPVILGPLVAAVGFLLHGSVDLQWSFPATVAIFVILLGIGSRHALRKVALPSAAKTGAAVLVTIVALAGASEYMASAQVQGGLLSAGLGRYDEAQAQFQLAAMLNPLSPDPHYYLGFNHSQPLKSFRSAESLQGLNEARRHVRLAQRLDPLSPLLYSLAADLDRKEASVANVGRKMILMKSVEQNLERALAVDEWNHPDIEFEYAKVLEEAGAGEQARMLYEDITDKYSVETLNKMRAWFNGGLSRSEIRAKTESDPGLRENLNAYFNYADAAVGAHYRLALMNRDAGKIDIAVEHLSAALSLDPENAQAIKLLRSVTRASK